MYKIFFDNRAFVISGDFETCFSQMNGVACKVNTAAEMQELIAYFETARQTHSLWVYALDVEKAFAWFCTYFKVVEAAGGLVENKNGDYLLIYRLAHWDLPKGRREKNETPEETALREVEEECSLSNLNLYPHITNTYHTYWQNKQICLKKTYWYKMKYNGNAQPKPQADEGIEKAVWLPVDEVVRLVPAMYCSAADVFRHAGIIDADTIEMRLS